MRCQCLRDERPEGADAIRTSVVNFDCTATVCLQVYNNYTVFTLFMVWTIVNGERVGWVYERNREIEDFRERRAGAEKTRHFPKRFPVSCAFWVVKIP